MEMKSDSDKQSEVIERRRRGGRRAFLWMAVASVVILGGYIGWRIWSHNSISTDDAQVDADVVPLSARVAGTIVAVHARDNHRVKKGQVLVEIDPADYQAALKQAQAQLDAARAAADAADAQVKIVEASSRGGLSSAKAMLVGSGAAVESARAQVAAARASVVRAESEVTKADTALHRVEKLQAKDAATEEELETVQAASKAAHALLAAAQAQLDAAREGERQAQSHVAAAAGKVQQSGPVDAQVAAAEAQARMADAKVAMAQAALEEARLQLSYTEIKAPADGIASDMAIEVGQAVSPGSLVAELVPEVTYVVAEFKETDIGRIRPGQPADVEIDTFGGRSFEGVVASVSPATGARFSLMPADNATGNFVKVVQRVPVKIRWKKPPDVTMRAGLSAEVTVHVGDD